MTYLFIVPATLLPLGLIFARKSLNILLGYSAKLMCSNLFLAKRKFEDIKQIEFSQPPFSFVKFQIDYENNIVISKLFGLKRIAQHTEEGSLLREKKEIIFQRKTTVESETKLQRSSLSVNFQNHLNEYLNTIFEKQSKDDFTKAIVIAKNDVIIAEQYAQSFDETSVLPAWSITKTLMNTFCGMLYSQKLLDLEQCELFPEWKKDRRKNIKLKHLLQMNSGLKWNEEYGHISDVTKMLYCENNLAQYAINSTLKHKIGKEWVYSSGTSNLISKLLKNQFIEDIEKFYNLPKQLGAAIGMTSLKIEMDASGTFVGSSYAWATARDWLKYGMLYCNEGISQGKTVINKEWIKFSTTPSVETGMREYGAHLWLNLGEINNPENRLFKSAPRDMIIFKGYSGQRIYIIPSEKLVIVRFGCSKDEKFNDNDFLHNILKRVK